MIDFLQKLTKIYLELYKETLLWYIFSISLMTIAKIEVNDIALSYFQKFIMGNIFYVLILTSLVITALIAAKIFGIRI